MIGSGKNARIWGKAAAGFKAAARRSFKRAAAAALAAVMAAAGAFGGTAAAAERPHYISATYCSDEWVITFWNSESAHMEEELKQIAADGFNSIILVVPWREFQPSMSPVRYEDYAFDKLDRVMREAERAGLDVLFRVGYTWDYSRADDSDSCLERFRSLLYDDTARAAWRDYVSTLYKAASAHNNFAGGFLTWEDFWNFVESAGSYGKGKNSRDWAKKIGYSDYVMEHYTIDEVNELYGEDFRSGDDIYLPEAKSHGFKLFYEFYDDFLNEILAESQQVFPNLSMEVRLDVDPVYPEDGEAVGCSHQSTFSCGSSSFTSAMYSVAMGQEQGRVIGADEGVRTMDAILGLTQFFNGGKPIYVDQFLFMDNTPGFESNARLNPQEIPAFIAGSADVLRRRSKGYGIWTYRDYCDSVVYNAQFGLGESGWMFEGQASVQERDGNRRACLPARSAVSQNLHVNLSPKSDEPVRVRFLAGGDEGSQIVVSLDGKKKTIQVGGEGKVYEAEFGSGSYGSLRFESIGNAWVDDVKAYAFVTKSEIYGIDGAPGAALEALRGLNAAMR